MASEITYRFDEMEKAAQKIDGIAENFKTLGTNFVQNVGNVTGSWEGDSKTKFIGLINGDVNQYLVTEIPNMLTSLANLLRTDAKEMENADRQVAESIPADLGLSK